MGSKNDFLKEKSFSCKRSSIMFLSTSAEPPPKILAFNFLSLMLSLQAGPKFTLLYPRAISLWDWEVYTFSFFSHLFLNLLWTCKVFIYLPTAWMSMLWPGWNGSTVLFVLYLNVQLLDSHTLCWKIYGTKYSRMDQVKFVEDTL